MRSRFSVSSSVLQPSRALARAASHPAWPAPTTTTSWLSSASAWLSKAAALRDLLMLLVSFRFVALRPVSAFSCKETTPILFLLQISQNQPRPSNKHPGVPKPKKSFQAQQHYLARAEACTWSFVCPKRLERCELTWLRPSDAHALQRPEQLARALLFTRPVSMALNLHTNHLRPALGRSKRLARHRDARLATPSQRCGLYK